MQRLVLDPLAQKVLEGAFEPGARLEADWDAAKHEVAFHRLEPVRADAAEPAKARGGTRGRKG
jgi:hypothetical protein